MSRKASFVDDRGLLSDPVPATYQAVTSVRFVSESETNQKRSSVLKSRILESVVKSSE